MRRLITAFLLVLIAGLPAIDVLYCPDGCTDGGRPALTSNTDEAANEQGCGLCTNAVAVHSPVMTTEPRQEFVPLYEAIAPANPAISLRSIDRPPRRA